MMRKRSRSKGRRALLAAVLGAAALPALAQDFPSRPIRILVGFPPGGAVDTCVRAVAPKLSEVLGQPVLVENRPGAGATIATEAAVRAVPDGYTLVYGSIGTLVVNPIIFRDLTYDVRRDLLPIGFLVDVANVLVVPSVRPWQNAGDLIAAAKAAPGHLNWGHSGVGTAGHLTAHLFERAAGIDVVGVAYRGGAALATDLMAGRVDYSFSTVASVLPNIREGKLRAIAVPSAERQPWLPDVPTLAESGLPEFAATNWSGLLAPRGTPEPVMARLTAALEEAMRDPATLEVLVRNGLAPMRGGPDAFRAFWDRERVRWEPVVRASGARPD
jgi:tripartite-type tricarboxylate transporter receptor subunit TctC